MQVKFKSCVQLVGCALGLLMSCDLAIAQLGLNQKADDDLQMSARFHLETGTAKGFLIVKIKIPNDSYIYSLTQSSPLLPSKLSVATSKQFIAKTKFQPDKQPKVIERDPVFETRVEKHSGTVQFYVPIKIAPKTDLKTFKPTVLYSGQICSDRGFCKQINNKTVQAKFAGYYQREAKMQLPIIKKK